MKEDGRYRRASERRPVALAVRLAYGDAAEFVERFATNISDGGIFIRTRDPRPVGTRLRFELALRSGQIVFAGEGTVRWVQGLDARGLGTPGMGLQFDQLTDESRALLNEILRRRDTDGASPPVRGAMPSAWRPIEEFPPPPPEEEPEETPLPPPVLAPTRPPGAPPPPAPEPRMPPAAVLQRLGMPVPPERHERTPAYVPSPGSVVAPPPGPPPGAGLTVPPLPPSASGFLPPRATSSPPPVRPLGAPLPPASVPPPVRPATTSPGALPPGMAPPPPPPPTMTPGPGRSTPLLNPSVRPVTTPPPVRPVSTPPPVRPARPPVAAGSASVALGLDLGWSGIRAAVAQAGKARALPLCDEGELPALVADAEGRVVVGEDAVDAVRRGCHGVRGVLRLPGLAAASPAAQAWCKRTMASVVDAGDGRAAVRFGRIAVPALDLAAMLLADAKARAEMALGTTVTRVVLAAHGTLLEPQRRGLREAAARAGLVIERIVAAPLAAVLAHHGSGGTRRVLVVDAGEGGFEAAVVEQSANVYEIAGMAGDPLLGALDIDLGLMDVMLTQFEKETGVFVTESPAAFERARAAAQQAREALSDALDHDVFMPGMGSAGMASVDLQQRITRARLQAVATPVADRIVEAVRSALAVRGHGVADLDEVMLVGGATRSPAIARRIAEKLGCDPVRPPAAAEAAVLGAALVAGGTDPVGRFVVTGAVGRTLGVGLPGGGFRRLLEQSTPLPAERNYTVLPGADARLLTLHLFQGESSHALDNEYVGTVMVSGLIPTAGTASLVSLLLRLNEDGELTVRARDSTAGRELPVSLAPVRAREELKLELEGR